MAENTQSASVRSKSPQSGVPAPDSSAATTVWVIPASVLLTGDQVAAALYAFSELIDECAQPTATAVREEVRFIVARHGADEIERLAEWLAAPASAPLASLTNVTVAHLNRRLLPERLAWCRRQSRLLLATDS